MFKSSSSQGELNGFLDAGSHMKGELSFEDTFRIDGQLTGSIVSEGSLVVGEPGEVEGDLRVRRIIISGTVRGTVRTTEQIEITSTGRVMAELFTPSLCVEDGAFFEGRCSMERDIKPKAREAVTKDQAPSAQGAGGKVAHLSNRR